MLVMAREKGLKVYYRTTPKLKGLYDGLMGKLRATDTFSSRGRRTSNDAIVNAFVLWADGKDPEEVARMFLPFVDKYDRIWADVPTDNPGPRDVVNAEPGIPPNDPPRRVKRKA
jgi:hypothetical protein